MAYEISNYSVRITLVAGADLSSSQYLFVKLDGTGKAVVCSAATDRPIGVLQNKPVAGAEAAVVVTGGTKLKAGASVSIGAQVGPDSASKARGKTVGTDTTNYTVGTALTAAAADEIFTAVIDCAAAGRAA